MTVVCLGPWVDVARALYFVRTPCTVLTNKSQPAYKAYRISVSYEYQWQGRRFKSDKYDFRWGVESSISQAKRDAVKSLKPGMKAECWVNPRDPGEAVMDRGLTPTHAIIILPGGFLVLGLMARRFGLKDRDSQKGPDNTMTR